MTKQFTLSIGRKLLILALVPLMALAGIGIYNFRSGSKTMELMKGIHDSGRKVEMISTQIAEPINQLRETSLSIALSPDKQFREKVTADYDSLVAGADSGFAKLKEDIGAGDKGVLAATEKMWQQYKLLSAYTRKQMEEGYREAAFINVNGPERDQFRQLAQSLSDWQRSAAERSEGSYSEAQTTANRNIRFSTVIVIVILVLLSALTVLMGRSITKPVNRVVHGLSEGAYRVSSASGLVSAASRELAEGSSEQAAAIEETSSSLEEMTSMTKQNAESAGQANQLMTEAKNIVGSANASMTELTASMGEISRASEDTQKIIKTIDEIAFQTNLLALNAAVEAARAGEAGAGFAVVADEVRNLAMRAADAAKNTAALIEGTVKRVKEGTDLVGKTNEEFGKVSSIVARSGELVGEIAAASHEQAQGIDQISKAVAEMDKVTQQNSANAEESASASEELNAQAKQMNAFVGELSALVGDADRGEIEPTARTERKTVTVAAGSVSRTLPAPRKGGGNRKALSFRDNKEDREVHPNDVFPMDGEDLTDF